MYNIAEIKDIFNTYVSTRNLVNAHEQQYVNVGEDEAIAQAVYVKGGQNPEFMKREDVLKRIRGNMQTWHKVGTETSEVVTKSVWH